MFIWFKGGEIESSANAHLYESLSPPFCMTTADGQIHTGIAPLKDSENTNYTNHHRDGVTDVSVDNKLIIIN